MDKIDIATLLYCLFGIIACIIQAKLYMWGLKMAKDYHKGYKLQIYIPEELNNKIDACIEALNVEAENSGFTLDKETKSSFIRKSLDDVCNKYLNER